MKSHSPKDNLVVQSNELIEASYKMTLAEIRVFMMCLSALDSREKIESKKSFVFEFNDYQSLFEGTNSNAFANLRNGVKKLYQRDVKIKLNAKETLLTRIVQGVVFNEEDKKIEVIFADRILPYLSQLEKNFTQYRVKYATKFNSSYSHRIYQLLIMWMGRGLNFKEVEIDDIREMLDMKDKYRQTSDFKKWVLDVALQEINEHSDIELEMLLTKRRRFFDKVQFNFHRKKEVAQDEEQKKIEHEKTASRNYAGKSKRLAEKTKKEIADQIEQFNSVPDGAVYVDKSGKEFVKERGEWLRCAEGMIPPADVVKLISSGVLKNKSKVSD